ncbi:putative mitochondrial import inner membrane translocase subunit tim44 [Elsinoe australis]|uniref:Mitochondrial import inner membrane translocase subunit TIM44 n=1 Tax=Elsinoe australis TaxID=40998 RepID=A0A4U7B4A0_9PEZI|nr:putative mitochondrial import inner membrane translocase subunit tim44 [Elsinoe australis]
MSALLRSSLLRTSTGGAPKTLTASAVLPSSQYGRTAAYRRLTTITNGANTSRPNLSLSITSSSRPTSISQILPAISYTSIRSVSFRELREARAQERAAESRPKPAAKKEEPKQQAKPEPTKAKASAAEAAPKVETSKSAADEAEEAYQRVRAASEKEEAKQRKRQQKAKEAADAAAEEGAEPKKEEAPEAPTHGNKTPWQVFTETMSSEFKASKEWNDSTKQLGGTIHDFTQNPNVQKARGAYTKATDTAATVGGAAIKNTASAIGKSAAWTWDTSVVKGLRTGASAIGSGVEKVTRPVRETEAYRNVKDVIDDGSSSRYGGWVEKEERRKKREEKEMREAMSGKRRPEKMEEDPEAGTNITLHKDAAWKESWRDFRDNSKAMQRLFSLKSTYAESENPLISTARSITDRVAGFFAENETATVIKKFREMDPAFQVEPFLQEMREYILPEVLDAYVKGDVETLKLWLSAAQYQVYAALMQQYTQHGLKSDGRILDIRNVDILNARMLEPGEIPVFVIMCRTQEVHVYRNKKSGQLASGMEDKVQQVTYAIGITRIPEDVNNPETRGWRLIELQKSGRDYI